MSTAVNGPWFDVPGGTPPTACRSCRATIYWIVTAAGKRMPVDCAIDGGVSPAAREGGDPSSSLADGRGVSHFATCTDAGRWRRR